MPHATAAASPRSTTLGSLVGRLNSAWHERALQVFLAIVLLHWAEHLAQAWQYYALGWPTAEAGGVLGLWFPALVSSELLHYGYAAVMLIGLWILRKGFVGRAYVWWMVSFWIQFWHHVEHGLLQGQAVVGANLLDSPVPVSIVQLWVPRLELHLIYNTLVFAPMVIAMYQHIFPAPHEASQMQCACAFEPRVAAG